MVAASFLGALLLLQYVLGLVIVRDVSHSIEDDTGCGVDRHPSNERSIRRFQMLDEKNHVVKKDKKRIRQLELY